jgi:hypothetical protein
METEEFTETEIHGYTTVSFLEGEGLPNLRVAYQSSALSSARVIYLD